MAADAPKFEAYHYEVGGLTLGCDVNSEGYAHLEDEEEAIDEAEGDFV